jgi:hypothetical protein
MRDKYWSSSTLTNQDCFRGLMNKGMLSVTNERGRPVKKRIGYADLWRAFDFREQRVLGPCTYPCRIPIWC